MYRIDVNSADLTYNAQFLRFAVEMSEISKTQIPTHIRIDSARSRRTAEFYHASAQRDADNDVLYWVYMIDPADARTLGVSDRMHIMVFND